MRYIALLANPILHFVLLLPMVFIVRRNFRSRDLLTFVYILLVLIAESVISAGLNFIIVPDQQWNWVGKGACFIAAVLIIISGKPLTHYAAGWKLHLNKYSIPVIWGVSSAILLLRLLLKVYYSQFHTYNTETIVFQATLPGLSEELVYRGLLLGLFNRLYSAVYISKRMLINRPVIWVAVLFGLAHGVNLNEQMQLDFSSQKLCMTFGLGLVLGWLRLRSGSLWPGIVFHNLWNLIVLS